MTDIAGAPNIGPTLAGELRAAGIPTVEALREAGALAAWRRIGAINADRDCASSLFALEGAARGIRWHDIPKAERDALWREARGKALPDA
jgi:DNA transformation protein